MNLLEWLIHGTIPVPGAVLGAREVIGNLFGLASAVLGMRRMVWAWPVGLVGNVLLFTVFATGELSGAVSEPLWGQAGRQVFFAAVSLYGWWRWTQSRNAGGAADGGAITPRWATWSERGLLLVLGVVGYGVAYALLLAGRLVGPDHGGVDPRRLDARDVRHGPRLGGVLAGLDRSSTSSGSPAWSGREYYPTAGMYLVYAVFVVVGFFVWVRASKRRHARTPTEPQVETVAA